MRALPPPPAAETTDDSVELIRAWLVDRRLQVTLSPKQFPDPVTWGILLADVATHVANTLHELDGIDRGELLEGIARAFVREMQRPTDAHTGEVIAPAPKTTKR
jgi:hypothetical protein